MRPTLSMLELRDPQSVPVLLSAVAGYIDSCTFLGLFGLFVAQVTGSFVVAGAQWVTDDPGFLIKVLGIPFFLLGGVVTTVVIATATARGGSGCGWAFGLEGVLLVCFLGLGVATTPFQARNGLPELATAFFGLSAMGVQSAQVRLLMKSAASTNVMTTNTTLIAIEATQMVMAWRQSRNIGDGEAQRRLADTRRQLIHLMSIAFGFFAGTVLGAFAYRGLGFWSAVLPAAILLSLSAWAALAERRERSISAQ